MPRGDKSSYTSKQKRKAQHIEEGYEQAGVGRKKPNGARGRRSTRRPAAATGAVRDAAFPTPDVSAKRGGRIGGKASASRSAAARSRSARKAAATRKRKRRGEIRRAQSRAKEVTFQVRFLAAPRLR